MIKKKDCIQERIGKHGKVTFKAQVRLKGYSAQYETFDRKTDAKMWIEKIKTEMREGRVFKTREAKKHTLGELIDRYIQEVLPLKKKSEVKQRAQLLWWKRQIGHLLLADVTPALIAEQRDKLAKEGTHQSAKRSPSTVVRYLAALSHVFTIAVKEWGWLEDSPMRKVTKPREPRGRVRFLSPDERQRLLSACKQSSNQYLYIIVVVALSTGMRLSEIMNLRYADVCGDRITLHQTKNGERRVVPVAGLALQLLQELEKKRRIDTTLLFPSKRDPQKPTDIRSPWQRAIKIAGIEDFVFHSCRHSAASELAMNGASLAEISEILGHKTLSMVKRYSHLSESHTAKVVASMNEKLFG